MSQKKLVLALDQGTTSSRAILFDTDGATVAIAQREFTQIFPAPGLVEHDPLEIWESQKATAIEVLQSASVTADKIAAIGITNQRETVVAWNRKTGIPIGNAIVWQDRRTAPFCLELRNTHEDLIRTTTGLECDAYFSASKIRWILSNIEAATEMADDGELLFGTIDSWLVWNLTEGKLHITDDSNASRTMLFNIHSREWDNDLLELFQVPRSALPNVAASSEVYGEVSAIPELSGIPIAGIAGDQQAALFGQQCFSEGDSKNTYGTGCFTLQNTGTNAPKSNHRLLTTIAWRLGDKTTFALEGSVFIGGAVIQWLRDSLGIISSADEVEELALSVSENGGVFFVPAFAGLGTPYWDQDARGTIVGLTRGTGRAHIARAALESIAFQTAELIEAMANDSGKVLSELRVDGGATKNKTLLQFQADLLGIPVSVAHTPETTALGAAYLAGLATGVWESTESLAKHRSESARFEPTMKRKSAEDLLARWREAVGRARG
ncbi:MAG: glycerol kinase GlpK [Pyrinomonadaceae bacterium]